MMNSTITRKKNTKIHWTIQRGRAMISFPFPTSSLLPVQKIIFFLENGNSFKRCAPIVVHCEQGETSCKICAFPFDIFTTGSDG